MKSRILRGIAVATTTLGLLAAFSLPMAVADSGAREYDYHIGDAFLTAIDPSFGPAIAKAPNGDTVEIVGTGTLGIHAKSVTGGGTVVHKDSDGNVIGSASWEATELLSFHSYGSGSAQGLPEEFEGGKAVIRVHIAVDGGGPEFDGILQVDCVLGDKVPGGAAEGVRLNVPGVANFNQEVSGATLFVRTD